ncbi:FtsB family cell division protein [Galenea microaerophila]
MHEMVLHPTHAKVSKQFSFIGWMMYKKFVVLLIVIIFLLLLKLFSSEGGLAEYWKVSAELEALKAKNHQQAELNQQLKQKVYALQHNPEAIETLARQKLGMIGENEIFIQVIETPKAPEQHHASETSASPSPASKP